LLNQPTNLPLSTRYQIQVQPTISQVGTKESVCSCLIDNEVIVGEGH
jgi:hypothetical protein